MGPGHRLHAEMPVSGSQAVKIWAQAQVPWKVLPLSWCDLGGGYRSDLVFWFIDKIMIMLMQ